MGTPGRRSEAKATLRVATCAKAEAGKVQSEKGLNARGGAVIVAVVEPVVDNAGVTRALVFW
jgi:hypothetical protein